MKKILFLLMPVLMSCTPSQPDSMDGVSEFLGIPYARAGHFSAPVMVSDAEPKGVFGNACPQQYQPQLKEQNINPEQVSDDCLSLNIWVKQTALEQGRKLPVMVWIHGGGFRVGGSALPLYNGRDLALHDVVVVTLNYRLGHLGFFAGDDRVGNFGLLDQITALKFIRAHIQEFGGDNNNITVFGESAGGASILYLMASPAAKGLFDKAIVQSGAVDTPDYTLAEMRERTQLFTDRFTQSDLATLPWQALVSQQSSDKADTMPFIYPDEQVVMQSFFSAFKQGQYHSVPLLIGSNSNEAGFFPAGFSQRVPEKLGAERWQRAKSYLSATEREHSASLIAGDLFVGVGTKRIADYASANNTPVYRYYFDYASTNFDSHFGAYHTEDVNYIFNSNYALGIEFNEQDRQLSEALQTRWTSFAKTGSPNHPSLDTEFEPYNLNQQVLTISNNKTAMTEDPNTARLVYLAELESLQIN